MLEETLKLIPLLKEPALMIIGGVIIGLFFLIFWLVKSKDEAIIKVVDKIDPAIHTMNQLATTVDTLIKVGRIK